MPKPNSSRPSLLLVDDTPANIEILVELLKADYDLTVATRGAQALQICAKASHLDLVLLDVMMPEMDGYEVCRTLRAAPATRELPIVFLTTKNDVEDIVRGFEIGANDYVSKPFHPSELRARVRTHTTLRAQQSEIAEKNTELKEMLHIVCHDVANHFAVVNMSLDLLATRPELGLARLMPRITAASRNGAALTTLVRDLRSVEDKPLQIGPVPLAPSIREALLLAEGRFQDKGLTATVEVPDVLVLAEPCALINSVLGNVISNAAKFSHPGGAIEIRGRVDDGMVCLTIRDHGIGMPPKVLEYLFDVSKSHTRKGTTGERGTGFGMPLMRKFVTLFGGRVEVETWDQTIHAADHGTKFHLWLKISEAGNLARAPS
jgi:two-component system sensor histidine kinase/response regulator